MADAFPITDGKDWDDARPGHPIRVSPFADHMGFDLVERSDGRAKELVDLGRVLLDQLL